LRASVLVTIEPRAQAGILIRLKSIPEVERVFTTSGRFDLLMQIAAPNTRALDEVLDQIGGLTGVRSSESLIHLSTRIDRAL
jgi:DNA-binding Lrp family transcriptional regulator